MIRIPQVRVVDEEGSQLGVMPTAQALALAQERGYDLVEVAPMAAPPVVRFLDFGQFKYEATKREKEAKRKQRSVTFKEVRLKPKIATGDFDTRVRRAIQFLEEGDRLKVAVQFRGRELTHPEIGRNLLAKFSERIKDHGVVERAPLLEGKSMHITVASIHKPKVIEATKHDEGGPAGSEDKESEAEAKEPAAEAKAPTKAPAPTDSTPPTAEIEAPAAATAPPAEPAPAEAPAAESAPAAEPGPAATAAPLEAIVENPTTPVAPAAKAPAKPATARTRATPAVTTTPAGAPTATIAKPAARTAAKRAPRAARAAEPEGKETVASTGKTAAKPAATTGE